MATLKDRCVFFAEADQTTFNTQTNGDKVYFKGMHLNADNAAALAYFIQSGKKLKIIVKEN